MTEHVRPLHGTNHAVVAMLGAVAAFAFMDAAMKRLSDHYPIMQVACMRGLASLPILLAWLLIVDGWRSVRTRRWGLQAVRGLLGLTMIASFVKALSWSSISDVYAVFLSAPLLIAALSAPILREHLSRGQWLAIAVGVAGVIVALRPDGAGLLGSGGALAFVAALSYALIALATRVLGRTDSAAAITVWFLACVTVGAGLISWGEQRPIVTADWGWIGVLGASGAAGQVLMTTAFRHAAPATVAPFEYTALLWSLALDWVGWGALPDRALIVGAGMIAASGIYLVTCGANKPNSQRAPEADVGVMLGRTSSVSKDGSIVRQDQTTIR